MNVKNLFLLIITLLVFDAHAADINGYTSDYECRAGGPQCNVDVVTIVARACDATITTADSVATIESKLDTTTDGNTDGSIVICADAGDYTGKGNIDITASGTSSVRRVFKSTTDNDPWDITEANRSLFERFTVDGSSYWIFYQIAAKYTAVNGRVWNMCDNTACNNNIFDSVLVEEGILNHGHSGNTDITIQNSVIRDNVMVANTDNQCIRSSPGAVNFHIVNNEIYDCGDGVLLQAGSTSVDYYPGFVIENNDIYQTTDMYCDSDGTPNVNGDYSSGENAIDVKTGGSSGNIGRIIHNRIWGFKKTDVSCGSTGSSGVAIVIHEPDSQTTRYVLVENNIIFDTPRGINSANGQTSQLSLIGNIFYNMLNNVDPGYAIEAGGMASSEFYLNTIIDVDSAGYWFDPGGGANKDVRGNVVIDGTDKQRVAGTDTEVDYQIYIGTTSYTTESPGTNESHTLNTRANSTAYSLNDLVRLSSDPPTDCTSATDTDCNLYTTVVAGTTAGSPPTFCSRLNCVVKDGGWFKVIRSPLVWNRKLLTGPEEFVIPYARLAPTTDAPSYQFAPSGAETDAIGSRTSIGVDNQAVEDLSPTDIRGVSR